MISRTALVILATLAWSCGLCSSGGRDGSDILVGTWAGTRAKNALSRVEIVRNRGAYEAHVWAFSTFEEIDWGKKPLHVFFANVTSKRLSRAVARWKWDFGLNMLIFKPKGRTLTVQEFASFKDKSGRSDYYSVEKLTRG